MTRFRFPFFLCPQVQALGIAGTERAGVFTLVPFFERPRGGAAAS
jgi:hypothetical protein